MNYNHSWLPISPADNCVICQKPFEQVQEYRLIATSSMGFGFNDTLSDKTEDHKTPTSELINFYGDDWFMKAKIFNRADTYCKNNQRPWGCMECFGQVCKRCGSPFAFPSDAFYIDVKGNLIDAPIIIGRVLCSNKFCSEYSNNR
jgi:hypothetical protein